MPCPNPAIYGITTGDHTENACADHALIIIDRLTFEMGSSVMVYQLQAVQPCDYKSLRESWSEILAR
jgi:hypothetical protein